MNIFSLIKNLFRTKATCSICGQDSYETVKQVDESCSICTGKGYYKTVKVEVSAPRPSWVRDEIQRGYLDEDYGSNKVYTSIETCSCVKMICAACLSK